MHGPMQCNAKPLSQALRSSRLRIWQLETRNDPHLALQPIPVKRGQVSGAAEPGSSVVDTAVRELGEEVNVEVGSSALLPLYCQEQSRYSL
jgi:8-oxo-dGTP pyrophosphatase MutT (NUDIX family)